MNKEAFKKEIEEIRGLLKDNNIHEAYDKMISLNEYNEDVDNYTQYFLNSLDLYTVDKAEEFELDESEGTILVEAVLEGYIPAKVGDIEATLKEIEEKFL